MAEPATSPQENGPPAAGRWRTCRVDGVARGWGDELVAAERPLTLVVNGLELATVACTPTDLEDLVVGFLTAEGVLCPGDPVARLEVDPDAGRAEVDVPGREVDPATFGARYVGSCCGKSRMGLFFRADAETVRPVESALSLTTARCAALMRELQEASGLFSATGGVHTAALASRGGRLEAVRVDIGRHNALDKLYGHALRSGRPLSDRIVAFSGRISSEVLLKVVKMGAPVLLSKSAPTELALGLAEEYGVTAVGFLRGRSMNVYTHPGRIRDLPPRA